MRWIWIDKFTKFDSGKHAIAVKCCTLAEDHIHDLCPIFPIVPHSLIVEGMAQTAGMLVGEARGFKHKVILAKLGKAEFYRLVRPGETISYDAIIDSVNETGASIIGKVFVVGSNELVADIEMMFSHIDNNMSGLKFPEENFVFTESFMELLDTFRREVPIGI